MKKQLRNIAYEELEKKISEWGEKPFRAKQIMSWIWSGNNIKIDEMTNVPKRLRDKLTENYTNSYISISETHKSEDRTVKFIFDLYDGLKVEGVMIPHDDRFTACISSQVGCSLNCKFCATGTMKMTRNLSAAEIFDQVVLITKYVKENNDSNLTNIVYMGMGEPLLNYKEVIKSIDFLTSPQYLNISSKRITVSTAGITKMVKKLAFDNPKINLAVSLHAATDNKRSKIMDINDSNRISSLIDALKSYYDTTKNIITFEYIAFQNFNDTLEDAKHLLNIVRQVPSKVNVIEYNTISGLEFEKSSKMRLSSFTKYLKEKGVNITVRLSRGDDISAACGQLAIQST